MPTAKEIITAKFIESLQAGEIPWQKPWQTRAFKNLISGKPYRGINKLILGAFGSGEYYLTFRQIASLGGYLKKGSKQIKICYYTKLRDEENDKNYSLLRYYGVFPATSCENIAIPANPKDLLFEPSARAEKLLTLNTCPITYGSHRAAYTPSTHTIEMPERTTFHSIEEFYGTAFHEIGHSLAEADQRSAVEPYSFEELCAEIFASFCLNDCGLLSPQCFTNSQAYIQGWAKKLQSDPALILKAASHADKRYDKLTTASSLCELAEETL